MIEPDSWEQFTIWVNRQGFSWRDLLGQDVWNLWTPVRVNWTDIGTPTVTGRFRVIGKQCFIQIQVVPSTSVATTAGTSYVELPTKAVGITGDGSMVNATTLIAIGACAFDIANSRIYVPTQVATGNTLTIGAWYEI